MSYSKEVTLWCDNCGDWTTGTGAPKNNIKEARETARTLGWRYAAKRDLCEHCVVNPSRFIAGR